MKRFLALAAATCLGAVFLIFGRSMSYQFVYDDQWTIVENPALATNTPWSAFFKDPNTFALPSSGLPMDCYRPLTAASFRVDRLMWGLNPLPYRIENMLLHGLAGFLFCIILTACFSLSPMVALLGALLFIAHPVQVET